jgi:tRNA-2-methylthio-N6-dimethylallyladenosine synthase
MSKNYFIITYGCQLNVSDSERIATVLEKIGYKSCPKIGEANLIVVNMCSVRQTAVDRVYGQIKNFIKLKGKNKKLKIVLTGCILKHDFKKFKEKFDYILSIKDLPQWKNFLAEKSIGVTCGFFRSDCAYLKIKPKYRNNFSAYVPIIIGCNNFCSYCVVPYTRGSEVSRPADDILSEVKKIIKKGYKEIWLLGENVNSYQSKTINFSKLLRMINDIPGNFWIRFTSSHPKDFSDELIKTIAERAKITKYISLPVQSGDDKILKKMNRPYTIHKYKNLIKKIRKKIPNVTLSTDVIVGFPGETKKQFANTIKLFKEIKPDMAYVARYSPRAGTNAFKMKKSVSDEEKEKRDKAITKVLEKTALENNKKYIGKIVEVLPASTRPRVGRGGLEYERKGWLVGKTKEYKTIKVQGNKNLIGKFVKVKVVGAIPWGLKGCLT